MSKHPVLWFFIGMGLGYFAVPYVVGAIASVGK